MTKTSRINSKIDLLYRLYDLEYNCKISGFEYEAGELNKIITGLEAEVFNKGNAREVTCKTNCGLLEKETLGHGMMESICLATGKNAPIGKQCTVSVKTFRRIYEQIHP